MTGAHFLREDVNATLLAIALFSLFAIPPGYVLSRLTGVLDFRQLTLAWRLVVSIPVSLSAIPMLAYWLDLVSGRVAVWFFFVSLWVSFVVLILLDYRRGEIRFSRRWPKGTNLCILLASAWAVLAFGSLVDIPIGGDRLYTSVTSSDQSYRTSFTDAVTRTSIAHPVNPTGFVGGAAPLRYHYFWFVMCSLVDQAGGARVPARHAFFAGTIWCGIALACVIAAYLRFFMNQE